MFPEQCIQYVFDYLGGDSTIQEQIGADGVRPMGDALPTQDGLYVSRVEGTADEAWSERAVIQVAAVSVSSRESAWELMGAVDALLNVRADTHRLTHAHPDARFYSVGRTQTLEDEREFEGGKLYMVIGVYEFRGTILSA